MNTQDIHIRKANFFDLDTIRNFQIKMAKETENTDLDFKIINNGVKAVLRNSDLGIYYLAEVNKKPIACLLTTYEWSDWRNKMIIWLQSVYVDETFRNQGVFSFLYDHILEIVNTTDQYGGIRLYVEKNNTIAKEVYRHSGMNSEHYDMFEWLK